MKGSKIQFTPEMIGEVIKVKSDRITRRERIKQVATWLSFCLSITAIIIVFELKSYDRGSVVQLASITDQFEDILDFLKPNNHLPHLQQYSNQSSLKSQTMKRLMKKSP